MYLLSVNDSGNGYTWDTVWWYIRRTPGMAEPVTWQTTNLSLVCRKKPQLYGLWISSRWRLSKNHTCRISKNYGRIQGFKNVTIGGENTSSLIRPNSKFLRLSVRVPNPFCCIPATFLISDGSPYRTIFPLSKTSCGFVCQQLVSSSTPSIWSRLSSGLYFIFTTFRIFWTLTKSLFTEW